MSKQSQGRPRAESANDAESTRTNEEFAVLSIGALSRATGVPVETLRTWERRYAFPKPAERGDSGHRRYPISAVERLKLVVRALEARHAPSVVLRASPELLRELVTVADDRSPTPVRKRPLPHHTAGSSFEARCTERVLELDGEGLWQLLNRAWDELGGLECMVKRIGPFLSALGVGWSEGLIEIGHEHFASEYVREFLSGHWRPMSKENAGPSIVCATIGGELHVLGLHMAATVLALAGRRVLFFGANTPPNDIARAATRQHAAAVVLSAAAGTPRRPLERDLTVLRGLIPTRIPIVVGGSGFAKVPTGVLLKADLYELNQWARAEAQSQPE
ncbi:MAG: MerR family transcriptional regulator [Pseudomonadota bacterium]